MDLDDLARSRDTTTKGRLGRLEKTVGEEGEAIEAIVGYLHFDKAHASAKTAKRTCREYLGAHDGYVFTGTNNTLIGPCVLLLEQWVMSVILLERHEGKLRNHKNPVQVVG